MKVMLLVKNIVSLALLDLYGLVLLELLDVLMEIRKIDFLPDEGGVEVSIWPSSPPKLIQS